MDQSKILITGSNGQLGRALSLIYPNAQAVDLSELDITNEAAVDKFDWHNTEYVLNAAGYTNVDGAETADGRKAAWNVNAKAVANLTKITQKNNITLVHISTDYVFDGTKVPHNEDESLSPLSAYGASKAAGDIAVNFSTKHYLLRTSWVIGEGKNFVRTMLELGKKKISPTVVADQIGRPTFTSELASAIDFLLTKKIPYGTYNLSNDGDPVSWADLTREIFRLAGFDKLSVTDTTTEKYFASKEGVAPRPLGSTLDLSKIKAVGYNPKDWREVLKDYTYSQMNEK